MQTTGALPRPANGPLDALARFAALDLSRPTAFAALASLFLLARAPFLNYGYGTDPDAWRVALTGQYLWEHGKYFPSRLPGNPLHEFALAPFVPFGWVAANLATALVSLAGVWLFARIVRHLDLPNPAVLVVGFAFMPLLFINSIAGMDYMWTLTMILAAYYLTLRDRPLWAGVFLGLAMGFRLQSGIAGIPLAYAMLRSSPGVTSPAFLRRLLPFGFAAAGVTLLALAPVLATYSLDFANFYDEKVEWQVVLRLLGKESLGVVGSLAVLAGLALSARRLASVPGDLLRDPQVGVWLLFIALYTFSFLRLPHEIGYMVPVFPFGLLFLGRYLSRAVITGVVAAVLVAGLVDITTPSDDLTVEAFREATIGKGLLLSNADTQTSQREFVEDILEADVPDHSVVIAGFVYPQLAMRARDRLDVGILQRDYDAISMLSDRGEAVDTRRDIRYVWLLTYDAFIALRSQGYAFFIVPDAAGGTAALYHYRPTLFGATFLPLDRPAPSAGKGTASTDR
ncbi:MAG TPA: glycosyltransferase family 87 protein [Dehalococcoidia bacterium]|nr:glycosyltransferase family 87 protein [Dehalococcoidia bacterium]